MPEIGIEICPVDIHSKQVKEFKIPFRHETNLVFIALGVIEDLFVHHYQTDQLVVVKGKAVLAVLQNRKYQYVVMSEDYPRVVKIPPGLPHGVINISSETCIAINSVIRHGPPHPRD